MTDHLDINRRRFLGLAAATGIASVAAPRQADRLLKSFDLGADRHRSATTTVEFWSPSGDAIGGPVIKSMVDQYNHVQGVKDGVHVNLSLVSYSDNAIKFTDALASPNPPDVMQTYSFEPVVGWAAGGDLQPLDRLFSELGTTRADYYPFVWNMQHFGGHTWAILQEWDADLLCWNKDIHAGPPPNTTDELDALSAKYTKFNSKGELVQAGIIPWLQGGYSSGGYGDWGAIWGASFYDYPNLKWTITDPRNRRFLEWYLKYVHMLGGADRINSFVSSTPQIVNQGDGTIFDYGKTAFALQSESFPLNLVAIRGAKGAKQLNWAINPNLIEATSVKSGKMCLIVSANAFIISAKSKNPVASAKFIRYMAAPKQLISWALPFGQGQPLIASANDPALLDKLPYMKYWAQAAAKGYYLPEAPSPVYSTFDTAMGVAINKLVTGTYTPAQALEYADKQVTLADRLFKEANPTWKGD